MTPAAIRRHCLSLPGAAESIQWGGERVFKVGGKMFAVISAARDADAMSFKAGDESFQLLTELPGLSPAPYLARAQWVRIAPLSSLPPADLAAYLRRAHALVAAKLPRKLRESLATNRTASETSPARRASRGPSGTSARSGTSRPRRSP
ncbi:MAG: MmcQ/YjbR family DNA-binding protein [Alphaproteobacteria bacterium]